MNPLTSTLRRFADATRATRWKASVLIQTAFSLAGAVSVMMFPRLAKRMAPIRALRADKRDRNVLFVSYYSPPYKSRYGTQRLAKFSRYLSSFGWNVTVFTTQPRRDYEMDPSGELLDAGVGVYRVPGIADHPFMKKGLLAPDDFVIWTSAAIKGIERILQTKPISVIVATAPPYTNMLAAAVCSARSGVPLVTDFRDPWTRIDIVWVLKSALGRTISAVLERQVLRISARVVMADEKRYVADYFVEGAMALADRVVSITNGYDEADFYAVDQTGGLAGANGRFAISYVGSFYSEQSCHAIIDVLSLWAARHPEDMPHVVFEYAGGEGRYVKSYAGMPCEFRDHGYIAHSEAIDLRGRCHIQLFVQPPVLKAHVFSGKIFEMIRIPRPILALTRKDGAVARLLSETQTGKPYETGEKEQAVCALKAWFDEWKRTGQVAYGGDEAAIRRYSRSNLAKQLSDVLDEVRHQGSLV